MVQSQPKFKVGQTVWILDPYLREGVVCSVEGKDTAYVYTITFNDGEVQNWHNDLFLRGTLEDAIRGCEMKIIQWEQCKKELESQRKNVITGQR